MKRPPNETAASEASNRLAKRERSATSMLPVTSTTLAVLPSFMPTLTLILSPPRMAMSVCLKPSKPGAETFSS